MVVPQLGGVAKVYAWCSLLLYLGCHEAEAVWIVPMAKDRRTEAVLEKPLTDLIRSVVAPPARGEIIVRTDNIFLVGHICLPGEPVGRANQIRIRFHDYLLRFLGQSANNQTGQVVERVFQVTSQKALGSPVHPDIETPTRLHELAHFGKCPMGAWCAHEDADTNGRIKDLRLERRSLQISSHELDPR